jgi:TP901-1 family phage major tail protein
VSASKGKLFLIQVKTPGSPPTYASVTSARSTDWTINNGQVDVTTKASDGWKELLEGAGISDMSISLSGVWTNTTQEQALAAAAVANTFMDLKFINAVGDAFEGSFAVSSYKRGGEFNGEETFTASVASAGVVTYTPAA